MHGIKLAACLVLAQAGLSAPLSAQDTHGIAMHGKPALPAGFAHFPYVNPEAPKGGDLTLGVNGTFDSLNPLIPKGVPAAGLRGWVLQSLMTRGLHEPFTLYGLLAERVEVPDDRSSITFHLRPEAQFSDGKPVTAADIIFSRELLADKGRPNHRTYYRKVAKTERLSARSVRFTFDASGDREMPLIMGLMPILPKHRIDPEAFVRTTLKPIVGSGPYVIDKVEPGKTIIYRRNPEYWGKKLNISRGLYNFETIRFYYYRGTDGLFGAFKTGTIDVRGEGDPVKWLRGYDFPAFKSGKIAKRAIPLRIPAGMSALAFNTRRPIFADPRVRQALTLLFDFTWINKNLYHGVYQRSQSFFARSELSSHGRPADKRERELLAPYAEAVLPSIMQGSHTFPTSDGSGHNRGNRRAAMKLLAAAGYAFKGRKLLHIGTGKGLAFEIMAVTRDQEPLFVNFAESLKALGITAKIRQVDPTQYQARLTTFDFDMVQARWRASLSPGNEQLFRWSRNAAATEGTYNYPGVKNPAVDAMIAALLSARSRPDFVSAVRALDRVLLSGYYVIPLFHLQNQWVAYWHRVAGPETQGNYGYNLDTWWSIAAQRKP
jgi:peptide/nickel transport system substrate-binding protein